MSAPAARWTSLFDELHERAAAQIGLREFGDTQYHEGLRVLLEGLDDHPPPPGPRAAAARGLIIGALVSRLHTEAQWRANPDYRSQAIIAPIIVIGLPRTGTTALHSLLSQDPRLQGVEKWLTAGPLVRPPRAQWESHPQYQLVKSAIEQWIKFGPEVMKAHTVHADEYDECLLPMAQNFTNNWYPSQVDVPLYDDWLMDADEAPSFRRYKDVLRLIGLRDDRRWLLKNPSHTFGVEPMLQVYPDACVVQTHRHPTAALASLISLCDNIMLAYTGEGIDRRRQLAREIRFYSEATRRAMAMQDRHPERFVNVWQRDIRADPLGVVRKIYDHFGIEMTPEAEARFSAWAAANPPGGRSQHRYETFDEAAITEAFAPYIARYGL